MRVAYRNLVSEKTRLIAALIGVAFAVVLILVMIGIFVGTTNQVTTYIDHSRGAVWVTQPGVTQMFRSVSWLPSPAEQQLTDVDGVDTADPILGVPSSFDHEDQQTAYYLVGYDTDTDVGGPWELAEGRMNTESGEVVLDRVLAEKNDVGVGDTVTLVDDEFTVVGLSEGTAAVGNFYAFVSIEDADRLLRAEGLVSYFLVQPETGTDPDELAERIDADVDGVNAMSSATFADNSRDIVISMIGRPLYAMIGIGLVVGIALVALTMLSLASEQMREFGVLKAVGVRTTQLYRLVLTQAVLLAVFGYLVGGAVAYGAQFLIREGLGDVTVEITPWMLATMAAVTVVMAGLGSVLPVRRVSRLDPAIAFR